MTAWQIIGWWEFRRLPYNAILFVIGIVSIYAMEFLMQPAIPPGDDVVEPFALILGVIAYGIVANLCYTLGWIVELVGRRTDEIHARAFAEQNFKIGLLFSSLLTTAPFWFGLVFRLAYRPR